MTAELRIAITLLAIAALIEGWFILRLMREIVKLEEKMRAAHASLAAAAAEARRLGEAAQRRMSRLKRALEGGRK